MREITTNFPSLRRALARAEWAAWWEAGDEKLWVRPTRVRGLGSRMLCEPSCAHQPGESAPITLSELAAVPTGVVVVCELCARAGSSLQTQLDRIGALVGEEGLVGELEGSIERINYTIQMLRRNPKWWLEGLRALLDVEERLRLVASQSTGGLPSGAREHARTRLARRHGVMSALLVPHTQRALLLLAALGPAGAHTPLSLSGPEERRSLRASLLRDGNIEAARAALRRQSRFRHKGGGARLDLLMGRTVAELGPLVDQLGGQERVELLAEARLNLGRASAPEHQRLWMRALALAWGVGEDGVLVSSSMLGVLTGERVGALELAWSPAQRQQVAVLALSLRESVEHPVESAAAATLGVRV